MIACCVLGFDGSGGEDGSLRAANGLAQIAPVFFIVDLLGKSTGGIS